jgi:hypothetical protein
MAGPEQPGQSSVKRLKLGNPVAKKSVANPMALAQVLSRHVAATETVSALSPSEIGMLFQLWHQHRSHPHFIQAVDKGARDIADARQTAEVVGTTASGTERAIPCA